MVSEENELVFSRTLQLGDVLVVKTRTDRVRTRNAFFGSCSHHLQSLFITLRYQITKNI